MPRVPWLGAVLIAVTATAIGYAYDAGSGGKQLTAVFAALYVFGCVLAVLAVRKSALFTAVIQPPLILFFSVPSAYWTFKGFGTTALKDILINCGYPLIERFPLMLFTSVGVLAIGLGRWYLGRSGHVTDGHVTDSQGAAVAGRGRSVTTLFGRRAAAATSGAASSGAAAPSGATATVHGDTTTPSARNYRSADRPARSARPAGAAKQSRNGRPVRGAEPPRSRHARPTAHDVNQPAGRPAGEPIREPVADRPRRPRPRPSRHEMPAEEPAPELRRRRTPAARDGRGPLPPRDPARANPYESSGYNTGHDPYEPPVRTRRPTEASTHHPVSRVRYRGSDGEERRAGSEVGGERRSDYRNGSRQRSWESDDWEYDI